MTLAQEPAEDGSALASASVRRRGGRPARRFAVVGGLLGGGIVAVALAAPLLAPYDPSERAGPPFSRPSLAHLLGTNDVGQDLLSELLFGARVSLAVGVLAAVLASVVGTAAGLVAGYQRGWTDRLLMRLVDVMLALPILPLAIVLGVFVGPGIATQVLVISVVIWAGPARELRAQVLSVRERDHVAAARAMGAGTRYALGRHVLPAVVPIVVPQFVLAIKTAILLEASLAFLGLGDAAIRSWGTTLFFAQARSAFLTDAWLWWVLPPGLAIAATVLAFALVGYALEERSRPRPVEHGAGTAGNETGAAVSPTSEGRCAPVRGDEPLLIEDLFVTYAGVEGPVDAVSDVTFAVGAGELVGLVGASGCGKSTLAAAATALLAPGARVSGGRVVVCGHDLGLLSPGEQRRLRGGRIALIPQEAMSALNPVMTVGDQIAEAVRAHQGVTRRAANDRTRQLLVLVGLDPDRAGDHPHQLSGGMRQRVVVAIALANEPAVVVADEPTTGLDPLVQADLLALLDDLCRRQSIALLVISHDLAVVERFCDRIVVMRAGRVVESGVTAQVVADPRHPYTRQLLEAVPRLSLPVSVMT